MSFQILKQIGDAQKKKAVVDVRSGDTVKVTQKIKEGDKERFQVFEGVVIRTDRKNSHTARITVRKIASGVGVEKSFLIHSPLVEKIVVVKRAKVRRKNLSYLRERSGKSARLAGKDFDRLAVNDVTVPEEPAEEAPAEEKPAEEAPAKEEKPVKEEAPAKEEKPAKEEAPKEESK
jgi:large subunit ribosomal protein L19